MSRLIDADKLYDYISDVFTQFGHDVMSVKDALKAVETAPTVNAVELPCKVGDTVWCITDNGKIVERIARTFKYLAELGMEIEATKWECDKRWRMQLKTSIIHSDDIGKTVFLTREEAEQALRERENNG